MIRFLMALLCGVTTAALAAAPPATLRFASYNVSFWRTNAGDLVTELGNPAGTTANHGNIRKVAEALQRVRPDVLLLNEFDYDAAGQAMNLFHDNFLAVGQASSVAGQPALAPLSYPYRYAAPSNTGVSTGFDLDNNGTAVTTPGTELYGNDCFGYGIFPGQYAPVVYSRYEIDPALVRKFQLFKWKDMPGSKLLLNAGTPPLTTYYSPAEVEVLRLSSKTHLDVPVNLGNGILAHFLVSHPTPPTFDAAEDKNGKRNFDEIRLWADYIDPARSSYLYDDTGNYGGLPAGARFVIAGDNNADPNDGDTITGAARQFTLHPLINASFTPSSGPNGGGANYSSATNGQTGNRVHDTAAFSGGLRVDYVLPSRAGFSIRTGEVFWPGPADPLRAVVSDRAPSDHHMVWMELRPQISLAEAVRNFNAAWSANGLTLTWKASAGYSYKVQQTANLSAGPWADTGVVPVLTPLTLEASAVVPPGAAPRMFYRLEVTFAP